MVLSSLPGSNRSTWFYPLYLVLSSSRWFYPVYLVLTVLPGSIHSTSFYPALDGSIQTWPWFFPLSLVLSTLPGYIRSTWFYPVYLVLSGSSWFYLVYLVLPSSSWFYPQITEPLAVLLNSREAVIPSTRSRGWSLGTNTRLESAASKPDRLVEEEGDETWVRWRSSPSDRLLLSRVTPGPNPPPLPRTNPTTHPHARAHKNIQIHIPAQIQPYIRWRIEMLNC